MADPLGSAARRDVTPDWPLEGTQADRSAWFDPRSCCSDGAYNYKNQKEVGAGIKASGVDRKELYLLSKLWCTQHKPKFLLPAIDRTLADLGTSYLDSFLIHWPVAFDPTGIDPNEELMPSDDGKVVKLDLETTLVDTWKAMIAAKESGKVRSIGVSNFSPSQIEAIYKETGVMPAVNEIEGHPLLQQPELHAWHEKTGKVHVIHYSPLAAVYDEDQKLVEHPTVAEIAKKHNVDGAQVLIAWGLAKGVSVIPKVSSHTLLSCFYMLSRGQARRQVAHSPHPHKFRAQPRTGSSPTSTRST